MAGRGHKDGVNVQVILRCRPFNRAELSRAESCKQFVHCKEDAKEVNIFPSTGGGKQLERAFHFDKVFGPESGQERLYAQAVRPIVEEVLEGFNCTIFAYGQTGTGKTYTMEGGARDSADGSNMSDAAGVIPRAIHQIFTTLDRNQDAEYTVKCSFLELYNEETTDLLAVGERVDQKLRILEDKSGVVIQGLEEFIVKSSVDIYALLDRGSAKRRTAETQLNKQSSRSHSVFCVTVHMREVAPDGEEVIKIGKLYLVDLAGSENVSRSGAAGTMAKEAGSINKSLLTLGRVITALVEGSGHIPYRDSKLTRLLRDSLGGKTKTCIIATIAPTAHCQDETLSTLDYAHRAKNIRNRPEVNQKISKTAHIKELNAEIDRLKAELFATREKNGVYIPADQFEQREESSRANTVRLEALEAEMERAATAHRAASERLQAQVGRLRQELAAMTVACDLARLGIQERDFLILAHKRSEAAVVSQAAAVARELQATAAALDGLHGRLEQHIGREAGNAALVAELRQTAATRFEGLLAAVRAAAAGSQARLGEAGARLAGFLQAKEAQLAALQARLGSVQGQVAAVSAAAAAGTGGLQTAAAEALQGLQAAEAAFVSGTQQAAAQAQAAGAAVLGTVADGHAEHRQQLSAVAAEAAAANGTLLAAVQAAAQQGRTGVAGLRSLAGECGGAAQAALQQQRGQLAALGESLLAGMQREKEDTLAGVRAAVEGFAARQEAALSGALAQLAAAAQAGGEAVGAYEPRVAAAADAAAHALKAEQDKAAAAEGAAASQREAAHARLLAGVEAAEGHCAALKLQLEHAGSSQAQQLAAHLECVAAAVAAGEQAVGAAAATADKGCAEAVGALEAGCEQLGAAGQQDVQADKVAAGATLAAVQQADALVAEFATGHAAEVAGLAARVEQATGRDFALDPAGGAVPARAAPQLVPADQFEEMRTPPAEVLLAEFRRQREGLPPAEQEADAAPESPPQPSQPDAPEPGEMGDGGERDPAAADARGAAPAAGGSENADPNAADGGDGFKSKIPSAKARPPAEGELLRVADPNVRRKRLKS